VHDTNSISKVTSNILCIYYELYIIKGIGCIMILSNMNVFLLRNDRKQLKHSWLGLATVMTMKQFNAKLQIDAANLSRKMEWIFRICKNGHWFCVVSKAKKQLMLVII
jgi:hypothetical protein